MAVVPDVKMGEFRKTVNGIVRVYDICYCEGYGTVCRGLGTTNGSLSVLTDYIFAMFHDMEQVKKELNDPNYKVEVFLNQESKRYNLAERWSAINPVMLEEVN